MIFCQLNKELTMFANITDVTDSRANEDEKKDKTVSEEAVKIAERSIRTGLIRSLAVYLFARTGEEKEVHNKIMTFVNALRSNNDIDADEAECMEKFYISLRSLQFAVDPNCAAPVCDDGYGLWYTIISSLFDDKYCSESLYYSADKKKCTDYEYEIMQAYREAQEAYWKARDAIQQHYRRTLLEAGKRTVLKYATTLNQIAPLWYKTVIKAAGLKPEVNAQQSE